MNKKGKFKSMGSDEYFVVTQITGGHIFHLWSEDLYKHYTIWIKSRKPAYFEVYDENEIANLKVGDLVDITVDKQSLIDCGKEYINPIGKSDISMAKRMHKYAESHPEKHFVDYGIECLSREGYSTEIVTA